MLFTACAGIAFVQRQWLDFSTYRQTIRIKHLDVLSGALSSPFFLFSRRMWSENPLLLKIALISWTLPFAAVITPGTLSVEPMPYVYRVDEPVGQPNPLSIYSTLPLAAPDFVGTSYTITPSTRLYLLAFTVATTSQILPMRPEFANQTYLINFTGPALKCVDPNRTIFSGLDSLAIASGELLYLAWIGDSVPWWSKLENGTDPTAAIQNFTFGTSNPDTLFESGAGNQTENNDNILWIMFQNKDYMGKLIPDDYTFGECQLWDARYEIELTYLNFEQTTVMRGFTYTAPVLSISTSNGTAFSANLGSSSLHKAILAAFASLIVGVDDSTIRYQPIPSEVIGLFNNIDSKSLKPGLEQLFQSITLSLFSVPEFWTTPLEYISTNVTVWPNTYVYQQRDLLLAYGISFLASLLCLVFGTQSFYKNGSSFQNNFSTYIRAVGASNSDARAAVSSGDTGADPLPKEIGEASIRMAKTKRARRYGATRSKQSVKDLDKLNLLG